MLGMAALLASLAIPALTSSMRDMRMIADAKNIATTMNYARMSASAQTTCYRMTFNLGTGQWSLSKLNRDTGDYEIQQTSMLSEGIADSGIVFIENSGDGPTGFPTSSTATVTFNSRGIPVEGPSAVYISNETENFAVSVSLTGKVQFWRKQSGQWNAK